MSNEELKKIYDVIILKEKADSLSGNLINVNFSYDIIESIQSNGSKSIIPIFTASIWTYEEWEFKYGYDRPLEVFSLRNSPVTMSNLEIAEKLFKEFIHKFPDKETLIKWEQETIEQYKNEQISSVDDIPL